MGVTRVCELTDLSSLKFVTHDGFMQYNNCILRYFELDFPKELFQNLNSSGLFEPDTIILHWSNMLLVHIHDFLMMLYTENNDLDDVCLNVKLDDFLGERECVCFVRLRDHVHDDDGFDGGLVCNEFLDNLFPDQMLEAVNARNAST